MNVIEKIKSFEKLNYSGWNGYDAEPITTELINRAIDFAKNHKEFKDVFPTGRGSIQFEKENPYFEVEIYANKIEYYKEKTKC